MTNDFTPIVKPYGTRTDARGNTEVAYWGYKLHPAHCCSGFKTEAAAKGQMTRHLKRGGLSAEWYKRHNIKPTC